MIGNPKHRVVHPGAGRELLPQRSEATVEWHVQPTVGYKPVSSCGVFCAQQVRIIPELEEKLQLRHHHNGRRRYFVVPGRRVRLLVLRSVSARSNPELACFTEGDLGVTAEGQRLKKTAPMIMMREHGQFYTAAIGGPVGALVDVEVARVTPQGSLSGALGPEVCRTLKGLPH